MRTKIGILLPVGDETILTMKSSGVFANQADNDTDEIKATKCHIQNRKNK